MDTFSIDSNVLGTEKHLIVSQGQFSWRSTVPSESWHFSGELKEGMLCFDTLLRLGGVKVKTTVPERYSRSMQSLVTGSISIPWQHVMPVRDHIAFIKKLVNELTVTLINLPKDYFKSTWGRGTKLLTGLVPARVDTRAINTLIAESVGNSDVVKTFLPEVGEFAREITYDRHSTRTGRLTVEDGPQILTLKREYRSKVLKSSFDNGKIAYIDFAALEARILLYEAGKACEARDMYADIARDVFGGSISRDAVKGAVIAELYGSSKHSLGESLGISGDVLDDFIAKIRKHFMLGELRKRLKAQLKDKGHITNRFSRPLFNVPEHTVINTYAQSTGVDVALIGFNDLIQRFSGVDEFRPLFVLHDALIVDCTSKVFEDLDKITHIKIVDYDQSFQLKVDELK